MELCEYFIKTYTRPGELVADICAGSGTTAVAALNTGRSFVCFETAPSFYAAASERIRVARSAVEAGEKGVDYRRLFYHLRRSSLAVPAEQGTGAAEIISTMGLTSSCALPVADLAAPDSAHFFVGDFPPSSPRLCG